MLSLTSECCSVSSEHHWITWPSCINNIYNKNLKLPANNDNLCITRESETTGIRLNMCLCEKAGSDQRAGVVFNNIAKIYTFKLVAYSLVVCSAQTLLLVQTHKYTGMCALGFTMSIFQLMIEFCDWQKLCFLISMQWPFLIYRTFMEIHLPNLKNLMARW